MNLQRKFLKYIYDNANKQNKIVSKDSIKDKCNVSHEYIQKSIESGLLKAYADGVKLSYDGINKLCELNGGRTQTSLAAWAIVIAIISIILSAIGLLIQILQ